MSKVHKLTPDDKMKLKKDLDVILDEVKSRRQHIQEFKKKQIDLISTL